MTKATLSIMGNSAILEADFKSNTSIIDSAFLKPKSFKIDSTFQKKLIQYVYQVIKQIFNS